MAGYFLTGRAEVEIDSGEQKIWLRIQDPEPLRTIGDLVHFDNVSYKWAKASKAMLEGVTFTVNQGGRVAFVGAVSLLPFPAHPRSQRIYILERARQIDNCEASPWRADPLKGHNHSSSTFKDWIFHTRLSGGAFWR